MTSAIVVMFDADISQGTFLLWPWQPGSACQDCQGNAFSGPQWNNHILHSVFLFTSFFQVPTPLLLLRFCFSLSSWFVWWSKVVTTGAGDWWIKCIFEQISARAWASTWSSCWKVKLYMMFKTEIPDKWYNEVVGWTYGLKKCVCFFLLLQA